MIQRVTASMAKNDCERILQAVKRKRDAFRSKQERAALDFKACRVYVKGGRNEGISGESSDVVA